VVSVTDGFRASDVDVLTTIADMDHAEVYGGEVAEEADFSPQQIYRRIDWLEEQGLLQKRVATLDRAARTLIDVYQVTDLGQNVVAVLDDAASVDVGDEPGSRAELLAYEFIARKRIDECERWHNHVCERRDEVFSDG